MSIKAKEHRNKIFFIFWLTLVLFLFFTTVKICEKYCFDKLVYRKDNFIARLYGYGQVDDLLCMSQLNTDGFREEEFYPKKQGEYLILVIGDSNVYGTGLLMNQRFSELLEHDLNKVRPTRVLNLGICGTNIYQHYQRYVEFKNKLEPDLVIVTFNSNDLLVWPGLSNFPEHLPSENIVFGESTGGLDLYFERVLASLDQVTPNMEMVRVIAPLFPKEEILIFSLKHEDEQASYFEGLGATLDIFRVNGLKVVDPKKLYEDKYRGNSLKVSEMERHPNKLANQMFAERLYEVLTTNPQYGFTER